MTPSLLSIVVLALLFLGAFVPRFSLAFAALPATFLVATLSGVGIDELFGFFPVDFVVLIVGISALFVVVQMTGTTDWLLSHALRPIGHRTALIPLLLFTVAALITAIGTLPAAVIAIMAPITLGIAAKRGLPPLLLCLTMLNGVMCGLFSPIAVFGATIPRLMSKTGIELPSHAALVFFLSALGTGFLLCLVAMLLGRRSIRAAGDAGLQGHSTDTAAPGHEATDPAAGTAGTVGTAVLTESDRVVAVTQPSVPGRLARWSSIAALVVLVAGGVVFKVNLGLLGLTLAFALQLLLRLEPASIIRRLPWEIILLIAGLLTYVGLMEHLGAFDRITAALSITGSPMLSLLVICFIAGLTSFFASSIAVIATAVPLIAPLVTAGVPPVAAIVAVALSAVLVDVNPLGITGALLLGSTEPEHRTRLFQHLMTYGLCSIVLGPLLAWTVFGWTL
ncbi:SLC13 family permease [Saccharopolyspora sp. NPDC050389]|uniref:SLC13 family permease n=1 Tax=Saccharopolyspora sp. NPDC050389 TaxID=3155516 RepID=UPI0033D729DA